MFQYMKRFTKALYVAFSNSEIIIYMNAIGQYI